MWIHIYLDQDLDPILYIPLRDVATHRIDHDLDQYIDPIFAVTRFCNTSDRSRSRSRSRFFIRRDDIGPITIYCRSRSKSYGIYQAFRHECCNTSDRSRSKSCIRHCDVSICCAKAVSYRPFPAKHVQIPPQKT